MTSPGVVVEATLDTKSGGRGIGSNPAPMPMALSTSASTRICLAAGRNKPWSISEASIAFP